MKNLILASLGALILSTRAALGQTGVTNPPPPLVSTDRFNAVPLLSNQELGLSLAVLVFGLIIVVLQYRLLLAAKSNADEMMRALTVTLIVVVSLALVASGYGQEQITPVLGLFGTIVGYLLGAGSKKGSGQ